MMFNKEVLGGAVGTAITAVGTSTQPNEQLQTISLVLTIIGTLITFILIPLLTWFKNASKDGKIDKNEAKEGLSKLTEGFNKVVEVVKDATKKDDEKGV